MSANGTNQINLTNGSGWNRNPEWSPDCKEIAFSRQSNGSNFHIWVMDVDGSSQKRITSGAVMDFNPAWSPDGTQIAFRRNGDIWVMNADGTNQVKLAK